jgi:hypothetical protein
MDIVYTRLFYTIPRVSLHVAPIILTSSYTMSHSPLLGEFSITATAPPTSLVIPSSAKARSHYSLLLGVFKKTDQSKKPNQ